MSNNTIKVFIAGDFCSKPSAENISVDRELRNIIKNADISIVNFEVPLKPAIDLPSDGYERFYQNDDTPDFLKALGFNLFATANNHMFDWEDAGYLRVKEAFGDSMFGSGTYDEAYKVKVIEVKGRKIGFMALTYAARRGVFSDVYNHKGLGCAHLFDLRVNHIIVNAKKEVDYLFIIPHAGVEYYDIPTPELIAKYRDFIDWGADGVIASHPHCPQGWERYNDKPIFYSLGNFFFNSKPTVDFVAKRPHWYEGIAVLLEITDDGINTSVINIRNIKNREITIDHGESRDGHNEYLCNLLQNDEDYRRYLAKLVLEKESYLNKTLSTGLNFGSLKAILKQGILSFADIILKRTATKKQSVKSIVNDEVSLSIFNRIINSK